MIVFNAKQHLKFYIYLLLIFLLPETTDIFTFIIFGFIGSLLPDIDHSNSIAGSIIPLWKINHILKKRREKKRIKKKGKLELMLQHGKMTHTLLFSSIIFIIYLITLNEGFYGLWLGYITHLIGDEFQGNNLPYLFYPFKRERRNVND